MNHRLCIIGPGAGLILAARVIACMEMTTPGLRLVYSEPQPPPAPPPSPIEWLEFSCDASNQPYLNPEPWKERDSPKARQQRFNQFTRNLPRARPRRRTGNREPCT